MTEVDFIGLAARSRLAKRRLKTVAARLSVDADPDQIEVVARAIADRIPWFWNRAGALPDLLRMPTTGEPPDCAGLLIFHLTTAFYGALAAGETDLSRREVALRTGLPGRPGDRGGRDVDAFLSSLESFWRTYCAQPASRRGRPRSGELSFTEFAGIAWEAAGGGDKAGFARRIAERSKRGSK